MLILRLPAPRPVVVLMKKLFAALLIAVSTHAVAAPACSQFVANAQFPVLANAKLTPKTHLLCYFDFAVLRSGLTHVLGVGGDALTISNGMTRVLIAGTLEIGKDKRGLKTARALKQAMDSIVAALEAEQALPDESKDEPPAALGHVDNPFL